MRRQELHPHTAVINRAQKLQSKKSRHDALQWLASQFPKAFDNTIKIQPLKTGIMNDILLHSEKAALAGFSKSKLREAVVIYTRRIDYLACLKARDLRVNLEGQPVGEVTEEEAERAANKIKKRIEKSLRNSRKTTIRRPAAPKASNVSAQQSNSSMSSLHQIERKPLYSMYDGITLPKPPPIIKHKSSRQFDPDAVARIKQRLGLKKKEDFFSE